MANRVSQAMAEVLSTGGTANVRVSQVMVEVLASVAVAKPVGTSGRWFSQLVDDVAGYDDGLDEYMFDMGGA